MPKLPIGVESRSGIQASLIDATATDVVGPDYGPAEIGAGLQILIIGLDIGIEPYDFIDLLLGFSLIDLRGDDL
jgi:hypothetical protein